MNKLKKSTWYCSDIQEAIEKVNEIIDWINKKENDEDWAREAEKHFIEEPEYKPGDILVDTDGDERKVLEVDYIMSNPNNFKEVGYAWRKEEMEKLKLKTSITKEEAEKRLRLIIKDKK